MKEKDLLKAIGQIDEKYIDQAMEYQPRRKLGFVKWITVALCLSLIIKYWPLKPMSDSPKGRDGEMLFDYGPIYPLRGDGEDNDLLVERELHFDFINNDYENGFQVLHYGNHHLLRPWRTQFRQYLSCQSFRLAEDHPSLLMNKDNHPPEERNLSLSDISYQVQDDSWPTQFFFLHSDH